MRWFHNNRPPEVWEVADGPLGDIEAAHKIRAICAAAASIADKIAAIAGRSAEKKRAAETVRYEAAVKRALEIAMQISDDAMRDVSVSQIIAVSVKADHLKTASILLRAIQSERTRAELIADHPALADQEAAG